MDKKENILKNISEDRKRLFTINKEIEEVGKALPFWEVFLIPLVISLGIGGLVWKTSLSNGQKIGIFLATFFVSLGIFTINIKKNKQKQREILIEERKRIQHRIFEQGKLLKD